MKERTIENLLSIKGRTYVYLPNKHVAELFLKNAEAEGFTFGDGVKPTEREMDDIFRIFPNRTICYVGFIGHLAFRNIGYRVEEPLTWVDYQKYISKESNYIVKTVKPKLFRRIVMHKI